MSKHKFHNISLAESMSKEAFGRLQQLANRFAEEEVKRGEEPRCVGTVKKGDLVEIGHPKYRYAYEGKPCREFRVTGVYNLDVGVKTWTGAGYLVPIHLVQRILIHAPRD